ncbi:putative glycoside hydrolase [uncultured Oscillibacter sp.]|uniref:putative glycoside hydrolase n=1 Tax=uncultured Oscillibacter sp. TaxID=876091 RepID=UPI0025D239AF|nr:putative glycoside hydrolase [uncultured Oscillibacter sp.]
MAGPRGYSSYRGKSARGKIALAVLLVLVIVGAAAVIRLQKYVVYDDSGRPRLELPWSSGQSAGSAAGSEEEPPDANLTIQEPERTDVRAVRLPVGPLTDWAEAWAQASDGHSGCNAAVYTVKAPDGSVYLDSQAILPGALKTVEGAGAAVGDMLKADGVYAVAEIACFRDPIAASAELESMGLKNTGGYVFYDRNGDRWLDPAKPAARQYLIDLASGCAAMGFDEILLTDVSYPTEGKLNKIDYGAAAAALPDSLTDEITSFLKQMQAALAEYDVKLSVLLPADLLLSGDSTGVSGQSLAEIAPLADRIYAAVDNASAVEHLQAAVTAAGKDTELVPVLASPEGTDGSWLLAS